MKSSWLDTLKLAKVASFLFLLLIVAGCHPESAIEGERDNKNNNATSLLSISIQPVLKRKNGALFSLPKGEKSQLRAIGVYSDNSTVDISGVVEWIPSDAGIATINATGMLTALQHGSLLVKASYQGVVSNDISFTITPATLMRIQVMPVSLTLPQGSKQLMTASGVYSDNTTLDISDQVQWMSSSEYVATVDKTGMVMAVAMGSVAVTASNGALVSNAAQLNVLPATLASLESIEVVAPSAEWTVGESQQISAKGIYDNGEQVELTSKVRWLSSNANIVSINDIGMFTALKEGDVVVTAEFDGITSKPLLLKVIRAKSPILQSVEITPLSALLRVGESQQFSAIGIYSDNRRENITDMVTWLSSNMEALTINSTGLGVALKPDSSSTINAMKDGVVSNSSLTTVSPVMLTNITVTPISSELTLGGTLALSALGQYDNNNSANITEAVTWQSSDTDIAIVNGRGEVSGISEGSADITASRDGVFSNLSRVIISAPFVAIEPRFKQLGIVKVDNQEFSFWNSTSINSSSGRMAIKALTKKIYNQFNDEFDFIAVIMNNASLPNGRPTGEYTHIKNDTVGLGLSMFDHTAEFGSSGKLQGVYFLYQSKYLSTSTYGPILHEMSHRWANWAVPSSYPGHWGNELGIVGQLNNVSANFADIELYLMGLIKPTDMTDPASIAAYNLIPQGEQQRIPGADASQKSFRTLLIIMTDKSLTDSEISSYNAGATLLTRTDNPTQPGTNFNKMTKGKGVLLVSGLDKIQK